MRLHYLLIWLAVLPMTAQTRLFTFGAEGGIPTQTPLGGTDSRIPFVVGPTVHIRVLSRLSLETGVLYHRMGQAATNGVYLYPLNAVTLTYGTERSHAFEVPLLARYQFLSERRTWRPFVTAGPAVRRTSIESTNYASIVSGASLAAIGPQFLSQQTTKWNVDPVVGAGVDLKSGRFHLAPEVRYSHWGAGKNSAVRQNQVDLLLGFRF